MKRSSVLGVSIAIVVLVLQAMSAAATGNWTSTGSMASPRQGQTATLLQNGKVLVAGGVNAGTYLSSAELYDPSVGTWSSAGSMSTPRSMGTATLLPSGKVLVAGGILPSGVLSSAELYDPAANTWALTGRMTDTRHGFTATLLQNGKVLVAGGGDSSFVVASAELYDPAKETWTATGSMAGPRWLHAATLLASGKVLVAGGQTGSTCGTGSEALRSAELYDPATEAWTSTGSLAFARHDFTVTLLLSGKVLAASGAFDCGGITVGSAELYDPGTGSWASAGSLATAREFHTATLLLPSGLVLVAGGLSGAPVTALASVELYDPAAGTWSSGPSMTTMRANHSATLLASGVVLVAGGTNGAVEQASAELFTADTDLGLTAVPANITVNATSPSGAVVNYAAPTALDEAGDSPAATASCTPASGSTFAIGTTTVTCTATSADDTPGTVSQSFAVTVNDTDLGLTGVPANITINATGPSGAVVSYTAPTAVDEAGDSPVPTVSCTPGSGSTFLIGTTTVTCTATDADDLNGPVTASFTVTVLGGTGQLNNLIALAQTMDLKNGISTSLDAKLSAAIATLADVRTNSVSTACNQLSAFINDTTAQSGNQLTASQANQLILAAQSIRATLGC